MSLSYSLNWYEYTDGFKHRTMYDGDANNPYLRDINGVLDSDGWQEMSICGKMNHEVGPSCDDPRVPYCESCYRLVLLEELGE